MLLGPPEARGNHPRSPLSNFPRGGRLKGPPKAKERRRKKAFMKRKGNSTSFKSKVMIATMKPGS